jgi:hypothetical protein
LADVFPAGQAPLFFSSISTALMKLDFYTTSVPRRRAGIAGRPRPRPAKTSGKSLSCRRRGYMIVR